MPGDLHTHTTFSDGSTPADKLPFLAACAGMTHLAISDHDSIQSVRYAYAHPVQNGVHLIPPIACICSATGPTTAPCWRTFPP